MSNEVDRTLWVGNLHEKVTEEILFELFLQAGPLEKVKIAKDKEGRPRNFAFITFDHSCSVPYTIELLNQTPLYGSPLRIQCRSGSVHQQQQQVQQQQQQQQLMQFHNDFQNMSQMGLPLQGNLPTMKPYRSAQPVRNAGFNVQSNMAANPYQGNQPRSSPQLQKSNTWHGNDLKNFGEDREGSDRERGRDRDDRNGDRYNSRERDRDRSGDRHRHGDRGRQDDHHSRGNDSRNSPSSHRDNFSNGHSSPQESQRDRLLRAQQASLNAYRQGQNSRSNSNETRPWQSRPFNNRRGRY